MLPYEGWTVERTERESNPGSLAFRVAPGISPRASVCAADGYHGYSTFCSPGHRDQQPRQLGRDSQEIWISGESVFQVTRGPSFFGAASFH